MAPRIVVRTAPKPPASVRTRVVPCFIAAVPAGLVAIQPDLGSAIVFAGILFAMLYWAGVKLRLLILLASPLALALLSLSLPRRGLQDLLAGTFLVPR